MEVTKKKREDEGWECTVAQLSIAWLLHRSLVMLPIPGTSSVAHPEENLKTAEISLSEAEFKEIESVAGQ
jgi:aryl-alcohol dehydrogenase-like predicted oxidoreductase